MRDIYKSILELIFNETGDFDITEKMQTFLKQLLRWTLAF